MDVRGVAREQHTSLAVGRRLPGHIGETGDPRRAVSAGCTYGLKIMKEDGNFVRNLAGCLGSGD
jgi:hypothetical protein